MTSLSYKNIGQQGEGLAKEFLERQGYQIVESNYRFAKGPKGEIDFIARDRDTICFVEVKTRRSHQCGFPEESVIRRKQSQIIRLAKAYVQLNRLEEKNVRFDVVAVNYGADGRASLDLMKNAFETR